MTTHIVLTAIVCLAAAPCQPTEVRVWDGDTAWFGDVKVRMVGYDTPEFAGRARCPAEARLAEQARERLAAMLEEADTVRIKPTGRDSYDRTLARVTVDGRNVAETLIEEGLATAGMAKRSTWC